MDQNKVDRALVGVKLNGVGLFACGLPSWQQGRAVLTGESSYQHDLSPAFDVDLLPRNERRRATKTIRLALQVAQEAMQSAQISDRAELCSVFSCSGGDTETLDMICTSLALPGQAVSPNQFHNSVHNAPAGYWAIANGSRGPSTSLSAYDSSFAAGLLDAVSLVVVMEQPVLMVAYDVPPPSALFPFRPLVAPFGAALLLCPESADGEGLVFALAISTDRYEDQLAGELEILRTGNPAARCLPMLAAIARGGRAEVVLPYFPESQLIVRLRC
ncbi:MAG: beta-ketoacyl synthase chain length factor [Gammaproteobacteria bacterium]